MGFLFNRSERRLRRWLDAEHRGRDDEAEAELAELLRGLGRPSPRRGFADRVLVAGGISPHRRSPDLRRRTRWLIVSLGVPATLAVPTLAAVSVGLLNGFDAAAAVVGLVRAVLFFALGVGEAVIGAWRVAVQLQAALWTTATASPVSLVLALVVFLSVLSTLWLAGLLQGRRERGYATGC